MTDLFTNIAVIITLVAVLAALFSRLRQPIILAFILVGVLAASSGTLGNFSKNETFDLLSELGIAFALFLVGLELKFSDIKQVGKASLLVGIGQIISTSGVGFLISYFFLGFSGSESIFLGIALTFSSTLIVIQLLAKKRDLDSLYGKIATGYLLVQDFAAVGALIFISSYVSGSGSDFLVTFLLGGLFVCLILILNKFFLQKLFDFLARDLQVLFLAAIAWALLLTMLSVRLGFSLEIGAFLAGLSLSSVREEKQIASWIRPLRDLFVVMFFLGVGLKLSFSELAVIISPVVIISGFVLVGNPLIMMVIMRFLGFRRRTSFNVGLTSAQVSEFSLIFIFLANRLGLVSDKVTNIVTAVALVTIVASTYLILGSTKLFRLLSPYLRIFEKKDLKEKAYIGEKEFSKHVVLIGAGRLGADILEGLLKKEKEVLVVDFSPDTVRNLQAKNIPVLYGDISDPDILERAMGQGPETLISTVFDLEDSIDFLKEVRKKSKDVPVVATSPDVLGALELYKEGATYVIVPRLLSSKLIENYLVSSKFESLRSGELRKDHIEELSKRNLIND